MLNDNWKVTRIIDHHEKDKMFNYDQIQTNITVPLGSATTLVVKMIKDSIKEHP